MLSTVLYIIIRLFIILFSSRILIFGDSLSHHGADTSPPVWAPDYQSDCTDSAPGAILGCELAHMGYNVRIDANIGRSAWNFWYNTNKYQQVHSDILIHQDNIFNPNLVIIFLGTNDLSLDKFYDSQAFSKIKERFTNSKVIAIGPPIFADRILNDQESEIYDTLNLVIGQVIDIRMLTSKSNRTRDGVHFNSVQAKSLAYKLIPLVIKYLI